MNIEKTNFLGWPEAFRCTLGPVELIVVTTLQLTMVQLPDRLGLRKTLHISGNSSSGFELRHALQNTGKHPWTGIHGPSRAFLPRAAWWCRGRQVVHREQWQLLPETFTPSQWRRLDALGQPPPVS